MSSVDRVLVDEVRRGLAQLGDPVKAPQMQAYMRSAMPFLGVQTPGWRPLAKQLARERPFADVGTMIATVRDLWHTARFREERYVALELTGERRWATLLELLPLYEELIVDGAWWDFVDLLAIHRVGPLLRAHPADLTPVMRGWAERDNLWIRRSSIISQVGSKGSTDTELLAFCIESNVDQTGFFLRKAIGWALREYSKTDPGWVEEFVAAHPRLSALSRREASKHLAVREPDGDMTVQLSRRRIRLPKRRTQLPG